MTNTEISPQAPLDAELDFVFWRHISYNVPEVIPKLENTDVILLEASPLLPKPQRLKNEALANHFLGAELTPRQNNILQRMFGDELPAYEPGITDEALPQIFDDITAAIIKKFHGSGKNLRHLDVNPRDHPEMIARIQESFAAETAIGERTLAGEFADAAALLAAQDQVYALKGKTVAERDEVVQEQIQAEIDASPGKKLTVVYGANHTGISHAYLRRGATRSFMFDAGNAGNGKGSYTYGLDGQMQRYHRFGKVPPIELQRRTLLKSPIWLALIAAEDDGHTEDMSAVLSKVRGFDPGTMKLSDVANDIARTIPQEVAEDYFGLMDQYLSSDRTPGASAPLMEFVATLVKDTVTAQ